MPAEFALNASAASAEHIAFADRGVTDDGHSAMIEANRRAAFDVIHGCVDSGAG